MKTMRCVCFVSVNVNNVPAVAPRHLVSYVEEMVPESGGSFIIYDVAKDDVRRLDQILNGLLKEPPGLLAASAFVWNLHYLKELAVALRKEAPDTVLVFGGPSADTFFQLYPNLVDIATNGEGERFFEEVVRTWLVGGREALIKAPYWSTWTDATRDWPVTLTIRRSFVPADYHHAEAMAYVETSRGCPFQCAFCESAGANVRYLPVENVKAELLFFQQQGVRLIYFVDPSFLLAFDRAMRILRLCNECGMRAEIEVNLDTLRDHQLRDLVGIRGLIISVGVQSWNKHALDRADRRSNIHQLENNLAFLSRFRASGGDIEFYPHIILGLPGDNLAGFKSSVRKTLGYRPPSIFLSHLQVLPRTKFGRSLVDYDLTCDAGPPFLVRSSSDFGRDDLVAAHRWSDALAAWDNTFGLDSLYALADTFGQPEADLYDRVQNLASQRCWLTVADDLRRFRGSVEDELAGAITPAIIGARKVADFLRHCRLRFMKTHAFSTATLERTFSGLSGHNLVTFANRVRIEIVHHEFSRHGPLQMVELPRPMACIASGTRIWKIDAGLFESLFHAADQRAQPLRYGELLARIPDPQSVDRVSAFCEDLARHGALLVATGAEGE